MTTLAATSVMNYSGSEGTGNIDLGYNEVISQDNMSYYAGLTTTAASLGLKKTEGTEYDLVRYIKFVMLAIIVPIGILANIIAITVFLKSAMRKRTTGHYLISLTIADTVLLVGELILWLNSFDSKKALMGFDFAMSKDEWCKIMTYLRYVGRLWSSWMTVIITVERYITVAFPLHVGTISTPKLAKIVIIVELVCALVFSSFAFWTVGVREYEGVKRCLIMRNQTEQYKMWTWIVIRGGELLVPSIIVVVFTTLIIITLTKHRKARKKMAGFTTKKDKKHIAESQLNVLLITVAIFFVVVRLPYVIFYYVYRYRASIWKNSGYWLQFYLFACMSIAQALSVTNYACNFFLYCVCGSTFRKELVRVYCYRRNKREAVSGFSRESGNHLQAGILRKDVTYQSNLDVNSDPVTPNGHRHLPLISVSREMIHPTGDGDLMQEGYIKDADSDISSGLVNNQFSPDDRDVQSGREAVKFAQLSSCDLNIDSDNGVGDHESCYFDDDDATTDL